jgi:phosphoserine phosphatase RsbU/P
MNESDCQRKVARLEAEVEEMTAALAQAWDQLVPFLQDIPQRATSLQDLLTVVEASMAALEAPLAGIFLHKTGECLTVPTDIVTQDALTKSLASLEPQADIFHLTCIPSWHRRDCTDWVMVPLIVNGDYIGAMGVGYDHNTDYLATDYQWRLLRRMAERASSQLMAADLEESRLREARIAQELQIASLIQQSIQPPQPPATIGLNIESFWRPARRVGGDAWGWVVTEQVLSSFVLDVSGKGLPAALAAVSLHTAVTLALRLGMSPDAVIETVNQQFYDPYTNAGIFATLSVVSINLHTGALLHANAGHTPTILRQNADWGHIEASVPPIGVLDVLSVTCEEVMLSPGDVVILYSDGFSEIDTPEGLWGETGLLSVLQGQPVSPQAMLKRVVEQADTLQKGRAQSDDQTLVVAQWKG